VRSRWLPILLVAAVVALQARIVAADPDHLPPPDRPWMLAVGDSITYGYTLDPSFDGTAHTWALQVRDRLSAVTGADWSLYSLACPGETTQSYRAGGCIGRNFVPALQGRSQRAAVEQAIRQRGEDLHLIVVELGTNDYFAARRDGGDVDTALDRAAQRVDAVVADLQRMAPGVPVVVADVYDPHGIPISWLQAVHLDARIEALAAARGVQVADFLHAVDQPGQPPDDRCRLLDCAHDDIHPTMAGQAALADAVWNALPANLTGQSSSFSRPSSA
jgi:lysophospholipase L1-like esterase